MKQTAVELLKQDLDYEMKSGTKMVVNWDMYLEKEKEQIIDAYKEGCFDNILDEKTDKVRAEYYYNETFKKEIR